MPDNVVKVEALRRPEDASRCIELVRACAAQGFPGVVLDVSEAQPVYPNAAVPLVCAAAEFRRRGTDVFFAGAEGSPRQRTLEEPLDAAEAPGLPTVLDRVFLFDAEGNIHRYVTALIGELRRRQECGAGVLRGLDWCLNEVMDNVLQHSHALEGFVMAQAHVTSPRLAICVADQGVGIPRSLGNRTPGVNDVARIESAMEKGRTRDARRHMGNGLWGLRRIVEAGSGRLGVRSGQALVLVLDGGQRSLEDLPVLDPDSPGTSVDFQLDLSRDVSISLALEGHMPVDLSLERLEDDGGLVRVAVADHESGAGTRRSGQSFRSYLINVSKEVGRPVIIDFSGVHPSSSFADEVIGMLVVRYGFVGFQRWFRLAGMDPSDEGIVHHIIARRMTSGADEDESNERSGG